MRYYVEALPGDTDTISHNQKDYKLYASVKAFYNHVTSEDYLDLTGYLKYDPSPATNAEPFSLSKLNPLCCR